jgi:hypothetical protein
MSVFVHTGWGDGHTFSCADEYNVDDAGNLVISTGRCGQVAVFSSGYWKYAEVIPTRDAKGRFTKAGTK